MTDCVIELDPVHALPAVVLTEVHALPVVPLDGGVHVLTPITLDAALGQAGLWTGNGPPGTIIGSKIGDEYLDLLTGEIYTLNPG